MVNDELINYIKQVKKSGHSDETIVNHLKNHGYNEKVIDDAFEKLNKKLDKLLIIIIILVSSAAILLIISLFIGLKAKISFSNPNPVCDGVEIIQYKYQDLGVICNNLGSSLNIQIPVENSGNKTINSLGLKIAGSKKQFEQENTNLLEPGKVSINSINYNLEENGKLTEITIIPRIYDNDKEKKCSDFSLSFKEISCN
ncbi:MAG: hypothetical protein KKF44_01750 [Nanoarchaeota archaeon]|nr:hypothetical protein [Nanoarchaeota archaeon]